MEHFQKLIAGLTQFSNELKKTSGALFLEDHQLSNVDLALVPWAYRFYVFETYRGPDFVIPQTKELEPYPLSGHEGGISAAFPPQASTAKADGYEMDGLVDAA
jgi:hypothetical protein